MFTLGLVAGALTTALFAMLLGSVLRVVLPAGWRWWVLAAFAAVVLAAEPAGRRLPLPQNSRQVPRTVILDGRRSGPFRFGYEMGTGVRTYMPSGLPHLLLVAVLLLSGPAAALLGGLGFGLGRAMMSSARVWSRDGTWWDGELARSARAIAALLALVAAAAVAALGPF